MSPPGPFFVVGSGPMIGAHTARLFATRSFTRIALFSRSSTHLARDASSITAAAPSATVATHPADVTQPDALRTALDRAIAELDPPEVVVYNAARIQPSAFGTYAPADIVEDFTVPNVGLYTTAGVVLPHLQALAKARPEAHPALFVTSGGDCACAAGGGDFLVDGQGGAGELGEDARAGVHEDVVHVAFVTVGGPVAPEEEVNNPQNVAERFWGLRG